MGSGDFSDVDREAARVLRAASEQIELALRESQPSVDALGEALRRLAAMLTMPANEGLADALGAMRAEMLRAITCLQFHDRMTQHLTHVRDYLSGSAGQLAEGGQSGAQWDGLHRRLRDRLLSETQRIQLLRNFPGKGFPEGDSPPRDEHAAARPGDVDLF
jgi:hypothetical protein